MLTGATAEGSLRRVRGSEELPDGGVADVAGQPPSLMVAINGTPNVACKRKR